MSIQQSLDGHSFSATGLNAEFAENTIVEVEILSAHTMLVPHELFQEAQNANALQQAGEALFAANGMTLNAGMLVVWSTPTAECVAIMALSNEAQTAINDRLGNRARYTTPLLSTPEATEQVVWICHVGGLLYIKVYDEVLRFAEVIPATTDADILYLMERVGNVFQLAKFDLQIVGDNPKSLRRLIGKRFKNTACE